MKAAAVFGLLLAACQPNNGPFEASLTSDAALDGTVARSGVVDAEGGVMEIGLDALGSGARGFLSFDISTVPPGDERALVVDRAMLVVHERGISLDPFEVLGFAFFEVVSYGPSLDADDFDTPPLVDAGVAAEASMVGEDHRRDVTLAVQRFFEDGIDDRWLQFRIRFPLDDDDPEASGVAGGTWNIGTSDGPELSGTEPVLELDFTYVQ